MNQSVAPNTSPKDSDFEWDAGAAMQLLAHPVAVSSKRTMQCGTVALRSHHLIPHSFPSPNHLQLSPYNNKYRTLINPIMQDISDEERITALSHLNDLGVFLLERNCYLQAIDTFNDALQMVPSDFLGKECTSKLVKATTINTIEDVLEKARQRVLSQEICPYSKSTKFHPLLLEELKSGHDIDTMLSDLPDDVRYIVLRVGNMDYSCYERSSRTRQQNQQQQLTIASTIAAYNCGVAHQAYARALRHNHRPLHSNNHRLSSERFLRLAESRLHKVGSDLVEGNDGDDDEILTKVLAVRMVALLALHCEVAADASGPQRAEKVKEQLARIRCEMDFLEISKKNSLTAVAA